MNDDETEGIDDDANVHISVLFRKQLMAWLAQAEEMLSKAMVSQRAANFSSAQLFPAQLYQLGSFSPSSSNTTSYPYCNP